MYSHLKNQVFVLADNFYCLTAPNKSRFPYCNGFLLTGTETILIDAGLDMETLLAVDRETRVDMVVFTHSHPDHILNWHLFRDRIIAMPAETPSSITDLQDLGYRFMGSRDKGNYWADLIGNGLGIKPFREPDRRFKDGDIIDSPPFRLRAIHAPGHLSDHYCFFEETSGTLITADIDFSGFGPFYGQPECDIDLFLNSIEKIMNLPYRQVCTSHRAPVNGDATRLFERFIDGFHRHGQAICNLMPTPTPVDALIEQSPIYRDQMPDKVFQHTFEEGMILKNLRWMARAGRVIETPEGFVAHHHENQS